MKALHAYLMLCLSIVMFTQAGCGSSDTADNQEPAPMAGSIADVMGGSVGGGMMATSVGGTAGPVTMQRAPKLVVLPNKLEFVGMPDLPTAPQAFTLQNQGDAALTIRTLILERSPGKAAEHFAFEKEITLPLVIKAGEEAKIGIIYTAPDNRAHQADLIVESDDPTKGYLRLGIQGRYIQDRVTASPMQVNLGSVPIGTISAEFKVTVTNGDVPHTVADVSTGGNGNFQISTSDGDEIAGRRLDPGNRLELLIKYDNQALSEGEMDNAQLVIRFVDDSAEALKVNLTVTGRSSQNCKLVVTEGENEAALARVDFSYVRIKTEQTRTLKVTNDSGVPCRVKSAEVMRIDGDELAQNIFTISKPLDPPNRIIEPMSTHEFEITYAPEVDYLLGDEWRLIIAYAAAGDAATATNLTTELIVAGVGTPALLGPTIPAPSIAFSDVTITMERACASRKRVAKAENVGFVNFCITGFALEGEHCDDFVPTSVPEFDECFEVVREPEMAAIFEYQFEPSALGERTCELVVTGDTDDADILRIALNGKGIDTDETTDVRVMGDVNRRREQTWDLSRPAVADTIRVTWTLAADPDAGRNEEQSGTPEFTFNASEEGRTWKIKIAPEQLPPQGADINIVYDRWCFDRAQ